MRTCICSQAATTPPFSVSGSTSTATTHGSFSSPHSSAPTPCCGDAWVPISFVSSRTTTVTSIHRDTVTCTGSVRHSRHGSPDRMTGTRLRMARRPRASRMGLRGGCRRGAARPDRPGVARSLRRGRAAAPGAGITAFVAAGGFAFSDLERVAIQPARGCGLPRRLDAGAEHCAVACTADRVAVYKLDGPDHRLLQHLCAGMSLGAATEAAATDAEALGRLLGWAFGEGLVVQIVSPSAPV